jgi:hypothetical protein
MHHATLPPAKNTPALYRAALFSVAGTGQRPISLAISRSEAKAIISGRTSASGRERPVGQAAGPFVNRVTRSAL